MVESCHNHFVQSFGNGYIQLPLDAAEHFHLEPERYGKRNQDFMLEATCTLVPKQDKEGVKIGAAVFLKLRFRCGEAHHNIVNAAVGNDAHS